MKKRKKIITLCIGGALLYGALYLITMPFNQALHSAFATHTSALFLDRNKERIAILQNQYGYYQEPLTTVPLLLRNLLLKKEDRFFAYHLGINPISMLRGAYEYLFKKDVKGSSTLTQQLVKVLLQNENERTVRNKLLESWYAFSLELHTNKSEILAMYLDTAYFGNQAEGIVEASRYYFNKTPDSLNNAEILSLLVSLNSPSARYPGTDENKKMVRTLEKLFALNNSSPLAFPLPSSLPYDASRSSLTYFEIRDLNIPCHGRCALTIDKPLTERIRTVVQKNLSLPELSSAKNAAVVVIDTQTMELLALIGSPYPLGEDVGAQVNIAVAPRQIGSTIKPFIYLKAFEKGARPYTLVEDREYKYAIGSGFPLYPKNYDGKYRGIVSMHEALSNSLNVPSVKVLEYVGLNEFNRFLEKELGLKTLQPLETYQLGIALGVLETDLLTLSYYFTLFPHEGVLKPLYVEQNGTPILLGPGAVANEPRTVAQKPETQLINKILSDRETGVEQFGIKSDLNLPYKDYAFKTGTSRDFHDSWIIGYTPDFLVSVWVGNSDNSPMDNVSGQTGAGRIWHEVMEILLNSPYNKKTHFAFDEISSFKNNISREYGLPYDNFEKARFLLLDSSTSILHPHNNDEFLFEKNMRIPFVAREEIEWSINGKLFGRGSVLQWQPPEPGTYTLSGNGTQITIQIITQN